MTEKQVNEIIASVETKMMEKYSYNQLLESYRKKFHPTDPASIWEAGAQISMDMMRMSLDAIRLTLLEQVEK